MPLRGCVGRTGFEYQTSSARKIKGPIKGPFIFLAERVGFEPTVRETVHLISNQAHSTTLAPLLYGRGGDIGKQNLACQVRKVILMMS